MLSITPHISAPLSGSNQADNTYNSYAVIDHGNYIRVITVGYPRCPKNSLDIASAIALAAWSRDAKKVLLDIKSFPPCVDKELLATMFKLLKRIHSNSMKIQLATVSSAEVCTQITDQFIGFQSKALHLKAFTDDASAIEWLFS